MRSKAVLYVVMAPSSSIWVRGLLILATTFCAAITTPQSAMASAWELEYGIAVNFYKRNDYTSALEHFQKALKKGNSSADNYLYIGHCYASLGRKQEAISVYQEVQRKFKGLAAETMATQCIARLKPIHSAGGNVSANALRTRVGAVTAIGASPTSADPGLTMPAEEKIPYVRGPGGHLFVNGAVNGHQTRILIDTGAFKVVIGKTDLVQLGVTPPTGPSVIIGAGAAGALHGWEMDLEISIGRIKRKMPVQVLDGTQVLLLGQPFLRGMHYQIDNSANYIHFTKDQKDLQKQMSYDSVDIPFRMEAGNLMVSAKVNGRPVELNFDTGAPHNCFSESQMHMLGLEPIARTMVGGAGGSRVPGYVVRADSIELGPLKKTNVECLVSPAMGQGLLGQEFFGHMRYVIDNEKHVIRFAR